MEETRKCVVCGKALVTQKNTVQKNAWEQISGDTKHARYVAKDFPRGRDPQKYAVRKNARKRTGKRCTEEVCILKLSTKVI